MAQNVLVSFFLLLFRFLLFRLLEVDFFALVELCQLEGQLGKVLLDQTALEEAGNHRQAQGDHVGLK